MDGLHFRELSMGEEGDRKCLAVIEYACAKTRSFIVCLPDCSRMKVGAAMLGNPALNKVEFLVFDALNSKGVKSRRWFTQFGYSDVLAHRAHAIYNVARALQRRNFKLNRDVVLYATLCLNFGRYGEESLVNAARTREGMLAALEEYKAVVTASILADIARAKHDAVSLSYIQ